MTQVLWVLLALAGLGAVMALTVVFWALWDTRPSNWRVQQQLALIDDELEREARHDPDDEVPEAGAEGVARRRRP
jgi:hypothetical protein